MRDYYLIISDVEMFKAEMLNAGYDLGGLDCSYCELGDMIIDWIGKIEEPLTPEQYQENAEAQLNKEPLPHTITYKEGLHLNIRLLNGELDTSAFLTTQFVEPTTPYRVFSNQ